MDIRLCIHFAADVQFCSSRGIIIGSKSIADDAQRSFVAVDTSCQAAIERPSYADSTGIRVRSVDIIIATDCVIGH